MNKEYLASLDAIRTHFQKEGVVSLKEFFDELPVISSVHEEYQPADFRYDRGEVELDELTKDFIENITDKKFVDIGFYEFSHRGFDLRKFFDESGVFIVANISHDTIPDAGGEIYVIKDDDPLQLPASTNTLTLISVSKKDESFVSYVNNRIETGSVAYIMGMLM